MLFPSVSSSRSTSGVILRRMQHKVCFLESQVVPYLWDVGKAFLSSAEVSTALRPFYFLVHPDLFGKYPNEQAKNEDALKSLKHYVDTLVVDKKKPNPKKMMFYIKPRTAQEKERTSLKSVHILLKDTKIRPTILAILKSVDLPSDYVDTIPISQNDDNYEVPNECEKKVYYEWEGHFSYQGSGYSSTDKRQPFISWLSNNVEIARTRLSQCEQIRLATQRLQDELCYNYNLQDILWDCGWETSHRRGSVESFKFLADNHPFIGNIVKNRTVVFGGSSGVSLSGHIILYSGDVRYNWLDVIKNVPQNSILLEQLPMAEKMLSQSLRYISIVHRKYQPITLVEDYKSRLRKLVTGVNDYKFRRSLPTCWPESMSMFKMSVETESSPLMLSPTGIFIVPASCPGFLLVDFITQGMEEAIKRMQETESVVQEEDLLVTKCVNELGLIQLDRDDSITSQNMITCCRMLLKQARKIRHLTHGNHLTVTRYYSVNQDGVICIPWDLTFGKGEEKQEQENQSQQYKRNAENSDISKIDPF